MIVYLIGWAISAANRRLFYPRRYLTTRFVLCLAVIPIIAELVARALYAVVDGGDPFNGALQSPSYFLLLTYSRLLVPGLACATADWTLRSGKWLRLGTIAGVGFISTLLSLYGLFPRGGWQWPILRPGLAVAIAALAFCWLLDQLTKERLGNFGPTVHTTAKLSGDEAN